MPLVSWNSSTACQDIAGATIHIEIGRYIHVSSHASGAMLFWSMEGVLTDYKGVFAHELRLNVFYLQQLASWNDLTILWSVQIC